jgi:hypothetical protein
MSFEKDNGSSDHLERGLTQRPPSRIANAAPACVSSSYQSSSFQSPDRHLYELSSSSGLFSFASTTLLLSLYNVNTRGIHTPNVILGMAIFTGGLLQFIAGMWEFPRGNVFGATGKLKDIKLCNFPSLFSCFLNARIIFKMLLVFVLLKKLLFLTLLILAFASFGCFWMSYSVILIPGTGVIAAYSDPHELSNAIGLFLIVWSMFTAMLVCVFFYFFPPFFFGRFLGFFPFNGHRPPSHFPPTPN